MLNLIQRLLLLLLFSLTLQAHNGLSQKHLVSLYPENLAKDISADTSIEIKYDLAIHKHSIHKRVIILKNSKQKKIKGTIKVINKNTLIFTPNKELKNEKYKVRVKQIRLQDYKSHKRFKRYARKLCSLFYDDVKRCRLYKYASKVKSKKIRYSFNVDDNRPKIISLTLNKSNIQLNEDNTTTISVNAKYDNNDTLNVTNKVKWIMSKQNIIRIDKNIITPKKEGTISLQAKLNKQTTKQISLTVYMEINGHKLPPEPNPTINNSTLLGIDSNHNGVRDDVERRIYFVYTRPIEQAYMMQSAKLYPKTLENPVAAASSEELEKELWNNAVCEGFLRNYKDVSLGSQTVTFMEESYFNTKERMRAYIKFNEASSGGVYDMPSLEDYKASNCDFNVTKLLEMEK